MVQPKISSIFRALHELNSALWLATAEFERGSKHASMYFDTAAEKAGTVAVEVSKLAGRVSEGEKRESLHERMAGVENHIGILQAQYNERYRNDNDPFGHCSMTQCPYGDGAQNEEEIHLCPKLDCAKRPGLLPPSVTDVPVVQIATKIDSDPFADTDAPVPVLAAIGGSNGKASRNGAK